MHEASPDDGSKEVHLFTLRHRVSGKLSKVLYWDDYGVVAPSLVTTNGNYRFLVYCIKGANYDVISAAIAPDSCDEEALLDTIRTWLEHRLGRALPRLGAVRWS